MINKKDLELKILLRESHIQQLNLKVDKLQQRIDKAIEYINNKEFVNYKKGLGNLERMLKHRQDLLAILKGVDKE